MASRQDAGPVHSQGVMCEGGVHARLVALQTTEELRRKAELSKERARRWTQEEIDLAWRLADELHSALKWAEE